MTAAKPWLLAVVVPLLLFALTRVMGGGDPRSAAQMLGGMLELAGLGLVVSGLAERRVRFGLKPSLLGSVGGFLKRLIGRRKPRHYTLNAEAGGFTITGGLIGAVVTPGPDSSVEHRLEIITAGLAELRNVIRSLENRTRQQIQDLQSDVAKESAKRVEAENELRQLIREFATDGLALEAVGIFWVALGIGVMTWPGLVTPLFELLM